MRVQAPSAECARMVSADIAAGNTVPCAGSLAGHNGIAVGASGPVATTCCGRFIMARRVAAPSASVLQGGGTFSEVFLIFEFQAAWRAEIPDVFATSSGFGTPEGMVLR